jgi:hypothetical protein
MKEDSVETFKAKLMNIIIQSQAYDDEMGKEKEIEIPSTGYKQLSSRQTSVDKMPIPNTGDSSYHSIIGSRQTDSVPPATMEGIGNIEAVLDIIGTPN